MLFAVRSIWPLFLVVGCGASEVATPPPAPSAGPVTQAPTASTRPSADPSASATPTPQAPRGPGAIAHLTTRCAAYRDGDVRCWRASPNVDSLENVRALAHDSRSVWAIDAEGTPHCDGCFSDALAAARAIAPLRKISVKWSTLLVSDDEGSVFEIRRGETTPVEVPKNPDELLVLKEDVYCSRNGADVRCWGYSSYGQHGHGSRRRIKPVKVLFLTDAVGLSRGDYHGCGVLALGNVTCWGSEPHDHHGVFPKKKYGVQQRTLPKIHTAQAIAGSDTSTCVLEQNGRAKCWGRSNVFDFSAAVDGPFDAGLQDVEHIAMDDDQLCAGHFDGSVTCMGNVRDDHPLVDVRLPGQDAKAADIGVGMHQSCAVSGAGELLCWGEIAGKTTRTPRKMFDVTDAVQVALGKTGGRSFDGCVLRNTGDVACWTGSKLLSMGLTDASSVSFMHHHGCALRAGGRVSCWGSDRDGRIGGGGDSKLAVAIDGVTGAKQVAVTSDSTCIIDAKDNMQCWGGNGWGIFANGNDTTHGPKPHPSRVVQVDQLSLGFTHGCAKKTDGRVACWGSNMSEKVIFTSTSSVYRPITRPDVKDARRAFATHYMSCALLKDDVLHCWGSPTEGLGTLLPKRKPRVAIAGAADVDFGKSHACVRFRDGRVACWGTDTRGQLGREGTELGHIPVLKAQTRPAAEPSD